jgi:hypothetical protein
VLAAQEYDSDKFAVAIIYMQRLLTRVSDAIPHPNQDENVTQSMTAPLYMIMATARKDLDRLVQSQPPEVQSIKVAHKTSQQLYSGPTITVS